MPLDAVRVGQPESAQSMTLLLEFSHKLIIPKCLRLSILWPNLYRAVIVQESKIYFAGIAKYGPV